MPNWAKWCCFQLQGAEKVAENMKRFIIDLFDSADEFVARSLPLVAKFQRLIFELFLLACLIYAVIKVLGNHL